MRLLGWKAVGHADRTAPVGPFDNNAFLLSDGDDLVLVDAAQDPRAARVDRRTTVVRRRHHASPPRSHRRTARGRPRDRRPFADEPSDAEAIAAPPGLSGLWDGDVVRVGDTGWRSSGYRPHPGGIALATDRATVITSSRTASSRRGRQTHTRAVRVAVGRHRQLFKRTDDDTIVLPGHGLPTTALSVRT